MIGRMDVVSLADFDVPDNWNEAAITSLKMQVVRRGGPAARAVVKGEVILAQLLGQIEQPGETICDCLRRVFAMGDDKMIAQHRKRIAEDHEIPAESNPLLFRRQAVGAQKAGALSDRSGIHFCSRADDPPRVELSNDL